MKPDERTEGELAKASSAHGTSMTDAQLASLAQRLASLHPTPQGRRWDAYAAIIATLVGLLALAVSGYTAYLQRQQLRAQVWPRLRVDFSTVDARFSATNQGTGPARITATRISVGRVVVHTWDELTREAAFGGTERTIRSSLSESVVAADKSLDFLRPGDDDASRARFTDLLPGGARPLAITICYCSVLDECWVTSLDTITNEPTACPIADADRFKD